MVDGTPRSFIWYQPDTPSNKPLPLVLVYHGYNMSAKGMAKLTGFNTLANKEHFIVVYPTGRKKAWNAGAIKGNTDENDVLFTDAIIQYLGDVANIDNKRIYATGISNGGFLAVRLACQRPKTFAAVGAVAATMAQPLLSSNCPVTLAPVPVAFINGKADPVVLWQGGIGKLANKFPDSKIAGVEDTLAFWKNRHQCTQPPITTRLPHKHPADKPKTHVVHHTYNCRASAPAPPLQQWVVEKGGHTWPGNPARYSLTQWVYRWFAGPVTEDIDATNTLWHFFKAFKR